MIGTVVKSDYTLVPPLVHLSASTKNTRGRMKRRIEGGTRGRSVTVEGWQAYLRKRTLRTSSRSRTSMGTTRVNANGSSRNSPCLFANTSCPRKAIAFTNVNSHLVQTRKTRVHVEKSWKRHAMQQRTTICTLGVLGTFLMLLGGHISGVDAKPDVFTNAFLVKMKNPANRLVADNVASRNGFVNLGPVSSMFLFHTSISLLDCYVHAVTMT